jgi:hypothetical protein
MKAILITILTIFPVFMGGFFSGQTNNIGGEQIFKPGEVLNYEMSYGWIKGGEASLNFAAGEFPGQGCLSC